MYGDRVKEIRKNMGWSLRKLAAESGINPSVVSRVESGKQLHTSARTLQRIAKGLGVPVSDLMTEPAP